MDGQRSGFYGNQKNNRSRNESAKLGSHPLSTAWCVAENMILATINEGLGYSLRIPLNREHDVVLEKLGVPSGWMTPCFIGIGYPKPDERVLEQCSSNPDGHIHMGAGINR